MTAASWYADRDEGARLIPEAGGSGLHSGGPSGLPSGLTGEADRVNLDPSRHRLAAGTRVGDHLIVRGVLGEGGTAVVYEALHTRLGASVALKVVDVSEEFMEGARARLLREAQVCAGLEDPHIPRIYDVGELPDGTPYVVMERVSGRTLEQVLAEGPLPLDVAVQVADDLLQAVEAIAHAGIVHRDIKPPNIILQPGGEGRLRVRLMDFGVSKSIGSDREPSLRENPGLTQVGAIVGTPHYMAPEQIVGPGVDTRTDLYAVGVVAYEMMAGRTPFEGETTSEVVAAVLHTRPLPLRKVRLVHPELEGWVERAMAPQRPDRFPSARVMRDELQEAWDAHVAYESAAGRRRWARRARIAAGIGLVAAAVTLPLPAGYDVNALSQLIGLRRAAEPATGAPSGPQAIETSVSPIGAALPRAEAAAPSPSGVVDQGVDWKAGERAGAGLLDESTRSAESAPLPQAEPLRSDEPLLEPNAPSEAAAAPEPAPVEGAVGQPLQPVVEPQPSSEPMRPAATVAQPSEQARVAARKRAAAVAAPKRAAFEPAGERVNQGRVNEGLEPRSRQGVLLNEYVRQLDSHLADPIVPTPEPKRVPNQPAPNPFDPALPENPFQD